MTLSEALAKVQTLAAQEVAGNKDSHADLLSAIRELQLAAETPLETTSRLNFQIMQNISIRVAIEYGYLHVIAAKDGRPISAMDISKETKSDLLLTIRIMRVLTAIGLCDEVGNQLYAANERTRFKILPGSIAAEKHHFDLDFGMGGKLVEYMRGPGIQQFADEPNAVTLFKYTHGTDVIFGLLEKNAEQKQAFDDYMAARRVDDMPQWFDIYPAAEKVRDARTEPGAILMVDVGGGPGQEIARFKEKYPDLPGRFILQDLPLTLKRVEKLPDGVEAMEYDFFTPQPVKGSRVYFLRDVLHNWSDAKSAQILSRIVEAMDPEYSTLLIDDYVLPDTGSELRAAEMDILMWLHTAGLERTVSQWKSLFGQVQAQLRLCRLFFFFIPMFKNLKEKHGSFFETKQPTASATAGNDRGQDLTSILDRSQRADLTVLVAEIAESMQVGILEIFDTPEVKSPANEWSPSQSPISEKNEEEALPLPTRPQDGGSSPASGESATQQQQRQRPGPRRNATAAAAKARAKHRTLSHFQNWRDAVLLRIGEVVNRDDETQDKDIPDAAKSDDLPLEEDMERIDKLRQVYHPIETPLLQLPKATRLLILHSLLLLLLSLKKYSAYSRVLLLYLSSSLDIDVKVLNENEVKVARGLLDTVLAVSQQPENKAEPKRKDNTRMWKVGIASVAGAALIGITGGLAAPLVAAGIGGIMGGLGLGATAAAGYLGALAGSSVLVGGLFGAYGGRMTGRMMDKYAREIEDFAFIPIRGARKQRTENESEAAEQEHRLRVTIGVTGWVKEESDFVVPWRVVGADSEVFALRWETESLMNLGNAISALVTSAAWSVAGREILSRTFFAAIMSAVMLPVGLMKVARVVDNPFSVAKSRADKAGEALADALINKAQGERPVTLIGYSLGSRVIYSCLQSLCRRSAYGLVESVILMGSPTPSDGEAWRRMRSVVSGRFINVFSENDSVLAFLYRTSSLQFGIAGLQPIEGVPGVENLDVSDKISGHLRYQYLLGSILKSIGLQDLDQSEIEREEAALAAEDKKQEEERLRNEREAGVEEKGSSAAANKLNSEKGFQEEGRMQKQVETQTEEHMAHHRIQMLDLDDDDYSSPLPDQSGKYSAI